MHIEELEGVEVLEGVEEGGSRKCGYRNLQEREK